MAATLLLAGCGEEAVGPIAGATVTAATSVRPADWWPRSLPWTPQHPVPAEVDGFPSLDVHVDGTFRARVSRAELGEGRWREGQTVEPTAPSTRAARSPQDWSRLRGLRDLLRELGIETFSRVRVAGPGRCFEIPAERLASEDHEFHLFFNHKKQVRFWARRRVSGSSGEPSHWITRKLLDDPAWIEVETR